MTDFERRAAQARARMQAILPEQMRRIDWPKERLDGYRQDKLRAVLAHAAAESAWHRARLSDIDPSTFGLEDLASLPVMTKADLAAHFDDISTDARVTRERCERHMEGPGGLLDDEIIVMASGGTSGVRATSVAHVNLMVETFTAGLMRFVVRWGLRTGAFEVPRPPFMVVSAPGHHGGSFLKRLLGNGSDEGGVSVVDPIEDVVAALNAADPRHVVVYSSYVLRLAEEARAGRLRIRPEILTPVAESFLPEHEAAVAEVWGDCSIISSWGATETGLLGAGNGFDPGMLLLDDMVVIEPVDADGAPVPPGTEADKLYVTPLSPRILPLVRYELTDQLTVLEQPATCGSPFTRVSYVRGRQDEEFVYGAVSVHAHTFRTVLSRMRAVVEYQIEQTPRGAHAKMVVAPGSSGIDEASLAAELASRLEHLGVPGPEVRVSVVADIPRTSGASKLRRFVALRGPAAGAALATATSTAGDARAGA